ncbi:hypothetical protein QJS10_CPA05g01091 [Acorus calamus]|uniref:Uncharacterized protein n=1 Tax=Acorus calamus TaxID=4465 RepID=A0AAV9EV17_ACOCL|nr:hypothetical protein QJS10_CPA05g01091 [Acorus calamus]
MASFAQKVEEEQPTTNPTTHRPLPSPDPQPSPGHIAAVFLKCAHELKEAGNRLFPSRNYAAALHQYDLGLKLLPPSHPDRAVFHSNRTACLMHARPVVDYEAVALDCSLALRAQPNHTRALLRGARKALGSSEAALQDALPPLLRSLYIQMSNSNDAFVVNTDNSILI